MLAPDSLSFLISSGLSTCRVTAADHAGVLSGLFLTGLVGSLTHCSGMCGPFVLSMVSVRLERIPASGMREWHRLSEAILLPYHLGRAATYAGLGAAAASLAGTLHGFRPLAASLLMVAALLLLAMAVPGLRALLTTRGPSGGWWQGIVGRRIAPLFERSGFGTGLILGMALGFIPCGLLYGALAAAAATGNTLAGAMGMLAFAAGTVPMLLAAGVLGQTAVARWREPVLKWAPLLLVANAGVLGVMALEILG